jgi:pimeloyl-ACP methyl ester carboxylesterase
MKRAKINGFELEYEVQGAGDPVVLIHGVHIADALRPLGGQDALDPFALIHYHRCGYANSSRAPGIGTEDHARHAAGLLDHLGIERANVVGHSYGAVIAIELAALYPKRVASLALLEPAVFVGPASLQFMDVMKPVIERYQAGDAEGAVGYFFALIGGPDSRQIIERSVPGAIAQAAKDAATFFEVELPAATRWRFGQERAAAVSCRVLSVLGTNSGPLFAEGRRLLHDWFPRCEDSDIVGAGHLLQMQAPAAVAEAIAGLLRPAR